MLAQAFLLALLAILSGCEGFLRPQTDVRFARDGVLTFIRVDPNAPPLDSTEASFWVVRGQERAVEIRYQGENGYNGKCIRFIVPAEAPLRHPDGSVFEPGDSVRVTVRVLDPELFVFEFDPAGLLLNPAYPARMEVRYSWSAGDANGDGVVDERDETALRQAELWAQDGPGERWSAIHSFRFGNIQEIHGEVLKFTRYAFASD